MEEEMFEITIYGSDRLRMEEIASLAKICLIPSGGEVAFAPAYTQGDEAGDQRLAACWHTLILTVPASCNGVNTLMDLINLRFKHTTGIHVRKGEEEIAFKGILTGHDRVILMDFLTQYSSLPVNVE